MKTYAAYYDNIVREDSSSGGVFSLLAQQFEVVYGVAMTRDCYGAQYVRTEGDISPLRGSKYLQARAGDILKRVKKDLEAGRQVLFSGTGCQINGLKCFLGREYENLTCVDVVCHGAPSPKLWRAYALYQEGKNGKLKSVNFRCKEDSWENFGMKENQLYIPKEVNPFMHMFLQDYCLRPACYACHAKYEKQADLTIGDFWGIDRCAPEMNDGRGTSLVITRTEKGQALFDGLKEALVWKEVSYRDGIRSNLAEYASVSRPKERDTFFDDLASLPFEELTRKYAADKKIPFVTRAVRKAKSLVKKILRRGSRPTQRSSGSYGMLLTSERNETYFQNK